MQKKLKQSVSVFQKSSALDHFSSLSVALSELFKTINNFLYDLITISTAVFEDKKMLLEAQIDVRI